MKGVTIIRGGDGRVVIAPTGDMAAFRDAADKAVAAGPVRTITTESGIGLDMGEDTAKKAGIVPKTKRTRRAAQDEKE